MNLTAGLATAPDTVRPQTYEQQLAADVGWGMEEASLFFEDKGAVNQTLREIARKLNELGVPYAVCGGMALFAHGYRRFTEDVDILVKPDGLKRIHEQLVGRGYLPPFSSSKNLRDTTTKVKIEFLTTGQYPGDGKPKPIAFPDPDSDITLQNGIRYIGLKSLVELKLASGMTGLARQKDLVDIQELIRALNLPRDFASNLNPYVAGQFIELWQALHAGNRRYVMIWRNKWLTAQSKSVAEMAASLQQAADQLRQMQADGVLLESPESASDDYATLVTTDPVIAAKYGMEDEANLWDTDEVQSRPADQR